MPIPAIPPATQRVIGIDHGYGNIKTVHTCFRAGVAVYGKEPFFIIGSFQYIGKWYAIIEEHKEFMKNTNNLQNPNHLNELEKQ